MKKMRVLVVAIGVIASLCGCGAQKTRVYDVDNNTYRTVEVVSYEDYKAF